MCFTLFCYSGIGDDILQPSNIRITLGQYDLRDAPENSYEMPVKAITTHPEYSCRKARNDIALLELAAKLQWSDFVLPACLPTAFGESGYSRFDNILATVAGWGWTNENTQKGINIYFKKNILI